MIVMVWVGLLRWSIRARTGPQTPAPMVRMFRGGCEVVIFVMVELESCFDEVLVLERTHNAVGQENGVRG